MNSPEYDPLPLPPRLRRLVVVGVVAVAVVAVGALLWVTAYVALMFGWHPIPSTAIGCSLHKRFHSFTGQPVKSEHLRVATCLKVTVLGREQIVGDNQKIAAVRAWLDARSDLWIENFINAPEQGEPLIVIRPCHQPAGTSDFYTYVDEDWIGFEPSKRHQRPICRGEWRELAAIITNSPL